MLRVCCPDKAIRNGRSAFACVIDSFALTSAFYCSGVCVCVTKQQKKVSETVAKPPSFHRGGPEMETATGNATKEGAEMSVACRVGYGTVECDR